ncbi:MAG: hypothetical protein KatS3mg062_0625 [Tepidiforma sp.]|nr:MAG: hypothetical protein KatS3mg062_0625 [Tepidiforma sp.]
MRRFCRRTERAGAEVLADVHHGTFATAAIGLVLLVKFGCLAGMTPATAGASVFAAVVAARGWLPAAAAGAPPLRDSGMGAAFRAGCTRFAVAGGCLAACAGPMAALGWWGAGAAAAGGAAAGLAAWGLRRALGGLNGDGYGACVEIGECAVLAAAAGFGGRLAPWGVFGW